MKKLAYKVDPDFRRYIDPNDSVGHLPDIGIGGYVTTQPNDEITYESFMALSDDQYLALEEFLVGDPTYHHLASPAVAFWPATPCWSCRASFSPHGYISKRVLMAEVIKVAGGFAEQGHQAVGICTASFQYTGVGAPVAFLIYACEYIDRVLRGVWKAIARDNRLRDMLACQPARLEYRPSKEYGGSYWAMTCPHCGALQGEHFLKKTRRADDDKPMSVTPQLLVLPKINGEDNFGGKVVARLVAVTV